MRVELDVNKEKHEVEVEPRTTLLDCLRDKLLLLSLIHISEPTRPY